MFLEDKTSVLFCFRFSQTLRSVLMPWIVMGLLYAFSYAYGVFEEYGQTREMFCARLSRIMLFLCTCVCPHTWMYVHECVCVYLHTWKCVHVRVHMCMCLHGCVCAYSMCSDACTGAFVCVGGWQVVFCIFETLLMQLMQ